MPFDTLTLVGVGLLGGSVGLAARRRGVVRRVVGTDHDADVLRRARNRGILDEACPDLAGAAAVADLVVFCTPVDHIAEHVLAAAPHCRPGTLLTDVGSTKAAIVAAVAGRLPPGVAFVGAHPLAGSEKHGPEHADADLFAGRLVVLTPCGGQLAPRVEPCGGQLAPRVDPNSRSEFSTTDPLDCAAAFWQALGARVRVMDAAEHDRAVALTSHLPHLAASALAAAVPPELLDLTATGFRDATRLAAGNADVWTAIFLDNRDALLAALGAFRERLDLFRRALEAGDRAGVERLLGEGRQTREALRKRET